MSSSHVCVSTLIDLISSDYDSSNSGRETTNNVLKPVNRLSSVKCVKKEKMIKPEMFVSSVGFEGSWCAIKKRCYKWKNYKSKDSASVLSEEHVSDFLFVSPEKCSSPVKKKRKSVKKEETVQEINARVADIIIVKAKSFDKMWKKNVPRFKEGNQVRYGSILRKEASTVKHLMVSVLHLNEGGLISQGIGPKTTSMMGKLLDETSE